MPPSTGTLPTGAVVHREFAYVPNGHARQKLDLYLPEPQSKRPLIIWIHGGAFRMGSKEGNEHDHVPVEMLAQGYALASINYRLSQHALFPAQLEDCKAAVRWLRGHASDFAFDEDRFGAWGPSAGGYLATMLGVTGHLSTFDVGDFLDVSSRVQAVVDFFGPTDFLQMDSHRMPEGMIHDTPDSPESELVGGPIQERQAEVQAANPLSYVQPDAPPFLVIHGDHDPLVPYHQSTLLVTALQAAGVPVTFYTVEGGGHGRFQEPHLNDLVQDFLATHLRA